jgi:hypothetical protein
VSEKVAQARYNKRQCIQCGSAGHRSINCPKNDDPKDDPKGKGPIN